MASLDADHVGALVALDVVGSRLDAHDERRIMMTPREYRKAAQHARALYLVVGAAPECFEVLDRSTALWELLVPPSMVDETLAVLKRLSLKA